MISQCDAISQFAVSGSSWGAMAPRRAYDLARFEAAAEKAAEVVEKDVRAGSSMDFKPDYKPGILFVCL